MRRLVGVTKLEDANDFVQSWERLKHGESLPGDSDFIKTYEEKTGQTVLGGDVVWIPSLRLHRDSKDAKFVFETIVKSSRKPKLLVMAQEVAERLGVNTSLIRFERELNGVRPEYNVKIEVMASRAECLEYLQSQKALAIEDCLLIEVDCLAGASPRGERNVEDFSDKLESLERLAKEILDRVVYAKEMCQANKESFAFAFQAIGMLTHDIANFRNETERAYYAMEKEINARTLD